MKSSILGILTLTSALMGGCSTPSVPLPPPDVFVGALRFSAPSAGEIVITGAAHESHAQARFFIFDRNSGDGVITTAAADGSFTSTPFSAMAGDTAEIYYEQATTGERSTLICVGIEIAQPLVSDTCR